MWAQLPGELCDQEMAIKEKVAFAPGSAFFATEPRHDCMRLNYSNRPPELIDEGMKRRRSDASPHGVGVGPGT